MTRKDVYRVLYDCAALDYDLFLDRLYSFSNDTLRF